mgnify:CR=1 FL=1
MRLHGEDYAALAADVERRVKSTVNKIDLVKHCAIDYDVAHSLLVW